jgi:hypothetical protein
VAQQLGVAPDLGHGRLAVVPQLPDDQQRIAGSAIRVGAGSVDVSAAREGRALRTTVHVDGVGAALTVGVMLPAGATAGMVTLDGGQVPFELVQTARGTEVRVAVGTATDATLVVTLR